MTLLSPWEQFFVTVGMTLLGLLLYFAWIHFLSWSTGTKYGEVWEIVKQNPVATAILRGSMYLGAVYLIATGLGRFVLVS